MSEPIEITGKYRTCDCDDVLETCEHWLNVAPKVKAITSSGNVFLEVA